MNKELGNYFRRHTTLVTAIVIGSFLLLAMGEYLLYRRGMQLNKMVSEGLMQLKEGRKDQLYMRGGKMMIRRSWETTTLDKTTMMPDGTKVTTDGAVIRPDGSRVKMMEGQMMDIK